jgi:hypothetical protein
MALLVPPQILLLDEISNGVGVKNLILLQVRSFKFFNKRAKRIYILSIIIQSALGILDIIGITLFGIIGAVISTAFTGNQTSNIILTVLRFLNLDSMTTSEITLWLSFITLSLFICKTLLALFFLFYILYKVLMGNIFRYCP